MIDQEEVLTFTGTTGRSKTNNNPFNLEFRPGTYQDKYGAVLEPQPKGGSRPRFAKFKTMMDGYLAGLDQLRYDQKKGHTLASFVHKFAPKHENPTEELIARYGQAVGAHRDTPLKDIPVEKLAIPMLARESSTRIVGKGGTRVKSTASQESFGNETLPEGTVESIFGKSSFGKSTFDMPTPELEDMFNPLKPQEPSKPFTPEVPKWGSVDQPNVRPTGKDVPAAGEDVSSEGLAPGTVESIFGGLTPVGESYQQPTSGVPVLGQWLGALGPKEAEANPGIRFGSRYIEILKGAVKKFPTTATGEEILTTLERQSLLPKGFTDAYLKDPKVTRDSLVPHLEKNWMHPKLSAVGGEPLRDPLELAKEKLAELRSRYTGDFSRELYKLDQTNLKRLNETFKDVKLSDGRTIDRFAFSYYGTGLNAHVGDIHYPAEMLLESGLLKPNEQLLKRITHLDNALRDLNTRTGGIHTERTIAGLTSALRENNRQLAAFHTNQPLGGTKFEFQQMLRNPQSSPVELKVSPSAEWMAGKQKPATHFKESEFAHVRGTVEGDRFVIQEIQSDWVKGHERLAKVEEATYPHTGQKFYRLKGTASVPEHLMPPSIVFDTREEANAARDFIVKNMGKSPPPEAVKNWHRQAIDSTLAWAAENPNINKVTLFGEETISHLRGAPKGNYPIYNTANKYFHTRAGELGAKTSVDPVSSVFSDFVPKHQAVTLHLDDKVRAAIKKGVLLGGAGAAVALGSAGSAEAETLPTGTIESIFGRGPGLGGGEPTGGTTPSFDLTPMFNQPPGGGVPGVMPDPTAMPQSYPQMPDVGAGGVPGLMQPPVSDPGLVPGADPGVMPGAVGSPPPALLSDPSPDPYAADPGAVQPPSLPPGMAPITAPGMPGAPPGMPPPTQYTSTGEETLPPGTVESIFGTAKPELRKLSSFSEVNYPQGDDTTWLQFIADMGLIGASMLPAGRLLKIPALAKQGALVHGLVKGTTGGLGYGAGKELNEALGMNLFSKHHGYFAESGPGKVLEDMALFTAGELLIPPAIQKLGKWINKIGHTKVAEKAWDIIGVPGGKLRDLLQAPIARLRKTHPVESTDITNARLMQGLSKEAAVELNKELTKLPFSQRHELLQRTAAGQLDINAVQQIIQNNPNLTVDEAIRMLQGATTTGGRTQAVTDVINSFVGRLVPSMSGKYAEVFSENVSKFATGVLKKVEGADVHLLDTHLRTLDAAKLAKKPLKNMELTLKNMIDDPLVPDFVKTHARDLYNIHAHVPGDIAKSANKAAEAHIISKLKANPGTVSSTKLPGYVESTHPAFKDMFVHKDIELELKYAREMDNMARTWYQKWFLEPWKTSKVVLRPASHFRDMFGAMILNDIGGLSFMNVPMYIRAFREMSNKGPMYNLFKETVGMGTTFTNSEIKQMRGPLEYGASLPEKLLHLFDKLAAPGRNLYNAEETWFKLAKFMHNIEKKGMTPVEAGIDALKYGLNYREVTPLIAKIRTSMVGAPFITYQSKVLPLLAESVVKHPLRVAKWAALPIALTGHSLDKIGMSDSEWSNFKQILPGYLKGGWYMPLPYRDDRGNMKLMNLGWLMPGFGEINEIIQRGENNPFAVLLQSPLFTIGGTLLTKQKPSGAPLYYDWEAPATKAMKSIAYIWQSLVPANLPGGTDFQAIYDAYKDRPDALTMNEAILANLGFRVTSIHPTTAMQRHNALKKIHAAEAASQMKRSIRRSTSSEETEDIIEQYQRDRQKILLR